MTGWIGIGASWLGALLAAVVAAPGYAAPPRPGPAQESSAASTADIPDKPPEPDGELTQHEPTDDPRPTEAAGPPEEAPDEPERKFLNLRYDEDYAYLDDHPEARGNDPWMQLKNIDLGGELRLDLGGEFRLRIQNRTNQFFGTAPRTTNTQQNYRWMLHANIHYGRLVRVFVQGIHAHVEAQDGPFEPTQENHFDLHQAFLDVRLLGEEVPVTLRVGRQELNYGHDRMIGAFEWVSTRRRFDAVKLFYESDTLSLDLFAANPVPVERTASDDWDDDYNFFGMYGTVRPIQDHAMDFYLFHSDRSDRIENPNGHIGGRSVSTAGLRLWGQQAGWDYDVELAAQWGQWAGDTMQAWFAEADVGYKFDHPWHPRIGTGIGWASGDDDPLDNHVGTWDQLFTYDHVCISMQDLVGRQNIRRWYLMAEAWPTHRIKTSVFYHLYWLDQAADYYYNAGGSPVFRGETSATDGRLGHALELMLEYQITAHSSIAAVYSHFWAGDYFNDTVGFEDDPWTVFIQYQFRF